MKIYLRPGAANVADETKITHTTTARSLFIFVEWVVFVFFTKKILKRMIKLNIATNKTSL